MKDKLVKAIREVPISKTYEEYVEALAEKFLSLRICVLPKGTTSATWTLMNNSDTKYMAYSDGRIEAIPSKTEVAREIFEELEKEIELAIESNYRAKKEHKNHSVIPNYDNFNAMCDGKIYAMRGLLDFMEELKKKYTESEDTE